MGFKELFMIGGKTALVTGAARGLGREIAQYGASLVKIHEAIVKQIPLRRFGKASEVVGAVRNRHSKIDIGFLKTNGIKLQSAAKSLFDVQPWTFDVRRSNQPCLA